MKHGLRAIVQIAVIVAGSYLIHEAAAELISSNSDLALDFWMPGVREVLFKIALVLIALILHRALSPKVDMYTWLTGALIVQHFASVFHYSVNVPFSDDSTVLLAFSLEPSFPALIEPFNGSKLVMNKLLTWIMITIHSLDFRVLIGITNIAVTALVFLLASKPKSRFILALLLLNLAFYNVTLFASSVCNALVVLFAVLSFRYAHLQRVVPAMIHATLAALTFGNGVFVLLLAHFLLKKWIVPAVYAVLFILLFTMVGPVESVPIHSPINYFVFTTTFLGSFFQFGYTRILPMVVGSIMLCTVLGLALSGYHKKDPSNAALIVFLLLSGMAVAYFRLPWGMDTALSNRYILYSLTMLIALAKAAKSYLPVTSDRALIIASGYALLVSFLFTGEVAYHKVRLIDHRDRILSSRSAINYEPIIPTQTDSLGILAIERGIWRP